MHELSQENILWQGKKKKPTSQQQQADEERTAAVTQAKTQPPKTPERTNQNISKSPRGFY
jgi:hypothetical protein